MVGMMFGILLLLAIGYFGVLCVTEVALWVRSRLSLRGMMQPQRFVAVISQLIAR